MSENESEVADAFTANETKIKVFVAKIVKAENGIAEHQAGIMALTVTLIVAYYHLGRLLMSLPGATATLRKAKGARLKKAIELCGNKDRACLARDVFNYFNYPHDSATTGEERATAFRGTLDELKNLIKKKKQGPKRQQEWEEAEAETANRIGKPAPIMEEDEGELIDEKPSEDEQGEADPQDAPIAGSEDADDGEIDGDDELDAALAVIKRLVGDDPRETLREVIVALGLKMAEVAEWAKQQAEWEADCDEQSEAVAEEKIVDSADEAAAPVVADEHFVHATAQASIESNSRDEANVPASNDTDLDHDASDQVEDTLTPAAEEDVDARDQQQKTRDEARAPVDAAEHVEGRDEAPTSNAAASNNGDEECGESDSIKLLPPEKRHAVVGDRISFKKDVWEVIAESGSGGIITLKNAAGKQTNIHSRRQDRNGKERYRILDKPRPEGEDLASMVVKALTDVGGGMNLPDLTEKVMKMGYKTQSQNLGQAIYNVLGKLKKDGRIVRDDEAKKYILVENSEVKYVDLVR